MIATVHGISGSGVRVVVEYAIAHKDALKERGYQWNPEHKAWYKVHSLVPGFRDWSVNVVDLENELRWLLTLGAEMKGTTEQMEEALKCLA